MKLRVKFCTEDLRRTYCWYFRTNFLFWWSIFDNTNPTSRNMCKKSSLQCYRLYNFLSFKSSHWKCSVEKCVPGNFAKFTWKHLWQSLFLGDCFWSFSCLFLKISCLFHFNRKNEMKKGKYPDGVQIFTFLLEYRFVWRQKFQKKFDRC